MKQKLLGFAVAAWASASLSFGMVHSAYADTYNWSYSSEGNNGSGTLTTGAPQGQGVAITSITGSWNLNDIAGNNGVRSIQVNLSSSIISNPDNVLYPTNNIGSLLDTRGLEFQIVSGFGVIVNIYFNGGQDASTN